MTDRATGYPCVLARAIKRVADLTQGEYEFSLLTLVEFVENRVQRVRVHATFSNEKTLRRVRGPRHISAPSKEKWRC